MRRLLLTGAGAGVLALTTLTLAQAEVAQKGPLRIAVAGKLSPTTLPRHGAAPISVTVGGRITSKAPGGPPQLQRLTVALNREGRLALAGLPRCRIGHIQPSNDAEAMAACGPSLIGEGHFAANVKLPQQSPFPSSGKVLAFNGTLHGRPAIFAHIYGTEPAPTSYVLSFSIRRSQGTFGTVLEAPFPQVTGEWGYVTGVSMTLGRTFSYRGKRRSYLSASCPAPAGFPGAVFPLLRTTFGFKGGTTLTSTLTRSCRVAR
jgi:hypothetical protein